MDMSKGIGGLLIIVALCTCGLNETDDTFGSGFITFTIEFVGISGDAGDLGTWPAGSGYTFTGVNRDDYRISKFEITNDQWNRFRSNLGVPVTGMPSEAYDNDPNFAGASVPTNNVSWFEAAQFVNWLNTSKGFHAAYKFNGTQGSSSYSPDTWSPAEADNGTNLYRHKDAVYYLPTEEEWLKAAYWNGTSLQAYATKPGDTLHQGDGLSGTGWNYGRPSMYGPWDVGSGSEELNGTYDMMGNLSEWTESPHSDPNHGIGSDRANRGAPYSSQASSLVSTVRFRGSEPEWEFMNRGFRVAADFQGCTDDWDCDGVDNSVDVCPHLADPDQADCDGDGVGDPCTIQDCDGSGWCGDCNGDGIPNSCELAAGIGTDFNGNDIPDRCEGLGDMDCSGGVVDFDDITPFVIAIGSYANYIAAYPDCLHEHGDIDGNGFVDFDDITPFVNLIGR
jgi:sulfatase modifying factor 1